MARVFSLKNCHSLQQTWTIALIFKKNDKRFAKNGQKR
jgi:hypothetical protein